MPRDELLEPDPNDDERGQPMTPNGDLPVEFDAELAVRGANDERGLRPKDLQEFVGQRELKERLGIIVEAARPARRRPTTSCSPDRQGSARRTLAGIVANEMGAHLHITSGPAIVRAADLAAILDQARGG